MSTAIILIGAILVSLALSVALALVGDNRYRRAFRHRPDDSSFGRSDRPAPLRMGVALLIGELVVVVPAISLLVGLILGIGYALQWAVGYDGVGPDPALPSIAAVCLAFVGAWLWWSIAAPRWLLWAMRRVSDPIALRNAAVGFSILCSDATKWGRTCNRTMLWTQAMVDEERRLMRAFGDRVKANRRPRSRPIE